MMKGSKAKQDKGNTTMVATSSSTTPKDAQGDTGIGSEGVRNDEKLPPLRRTFQFWKELFLTLNAMLVMPMYSMLIAMWIYAAMMYFAPFLWLRTLLFLYIPYILFLDTSPSNGQRPFGNRSAYRSVACYKWFAEYFGMKLVKKCNLDPSKRYIMLYHPHGIIGVGTNAALNTNGCDFATVFPGLERAGVTLNETFWAPLLREWVLRMGYISADKKTLHEALEVQSIVLVPGGAAEALHARPGIMQLYLKNRKGFVRLALETKCPLVPCIGFGENEVFETTETGSLQRKWSKAVRFSIPFLKNIVPRRAKITVVVGEPLDFGNETNVDKCHALYLHHLKRLYDGERAEYGNQHVDLEII